MCLLCFSISSHASNATALIQIADEKQLSDDRYWLALLHIPENSNRSEIVDDSFFLSDSRQPVKELEATLQAFFAPIPEDPNQHAQCRFIARFHWLQKHLPELTRLAPKIPCPLFANWSDQQQIGSVSAIFASGYLGNPASFYGHILLKFNSHSGKRALLQQQNLNFGAAVPEQENPVTYILKGLFGGYKAVFSYGDFYRNIQAYGETELRDLWEYQLALTPDEVSQLLYHSWELINRDYVYYFLKENCAFRMAQLLELVIETELISKRQPYAMPIAVFHRLAESEHHGKPLVTNIIYHPSRQQRLTSRHQQAPENVRQVMLSLIRNDYDLKLAAYQQLSDQEQSILLELLFDYIEFLKLSSDNPELLQIKNRLLQARLALPVQPPLAVAGSTDYPHLSTRPSMLQLAYIQQQQQAAAQFRFRATYYDLLSRDAGRAAFSALSMFDLSGRYFRDSWQVQHFELLNIENMNLSQTGLPGDGGWAWKVNLSYAAQDNQCKSCNTAQLRGGIGKAIPVTAGIVYLMQDAQMHNRVGRFGLLSADSRFGALLDVNRMWRTQLEVGYRSYLQSQLTDFTWYRWQNRFGDSPHWDIRLSVSQLRTTEWSLAYSLYW